MTQAVQHVGVTRSGVAIQVAIFSDEQQFELLVACISYSSADHFGAHAVFEYLISRELSRRTVNTQMLDLYERISNAHNSKVNPDWKQVERLALGLITIFNVLEHGKSLADRAGGRGAAGRGRAALHGSVDVQDLSRTRSPNPDVAGIVSRNV